MTHGSLFSGIGGFDLAAQWMGWENVFHCEINPFGRQVLNYYWPNAVSYDDITKTDFTVWRNRIDVLTGGFPCQPFSLAGKRKGTEDERHLWPEMLRAIREIKPRWIVGENVYGLVNWDGGLVFEQVQADLENEEYEVQPYILPAAGVNAPHKRDRVWFVAKNTDNNGRRGKFGQEESKAGGFGHACSGNNERIQTNDGETRTSPNSDHNGSHGAENGQGYPSGNYGSQAGKDDAFQPEGCGCEATGETTSNTPSKGLEKRRQPREREYEAKNRERVDGGPEQFGPTSADTDGKRFEECHTARFSDIPERQPSKEMLGSRVENWDEFPTQPPVRGRDDGIPSGLVGITVSKHRNESIKAYGNAIVPQVVYQIFKAIQEYEISKK